MTKSNKQKKEGIHKQTNTPVTKKDNITKNPFIVSNKLFALSVLVGMLAFSVIIALIVTSPVIVKTVHVTNASIETGYNQTEDELNNFKHEANINVTANGPSPQTLTVPVNTKIVWHNTDIKFHIIAISPGEKIPYQFYNNRTIITSGGYPFVIRQTGTFHYYYLDDPTQTGEVIVK